MDECLDEYSSRLGVTALPGSASSEYKQHFCQYTYLQAPNGKRIEIFGGDKLSSLQLYRARGILEWYLTDFPGSIYGASKADVFNKMGDNQAKLDMPNGAHEQPGAGTSLWVMRLFETFHCLLPALIYLTALCDFCDCSISRYDSDAMAINFNGYSFRLATQGQELFQDETPVEGSSWYMQNNYDHRDAALEEILHLVHDAGIGVDGASVDGALPDFQMEIRKATENAMPTWWNPSGKGIWAEDRSESQEWLEELDRENSLTQEYLAAVIDSAYGLWGPWDGKGGMWGLYDAKTPDEIASADPMGAALLPKFFHPYYTWMVMLDPSLKGKPHHHRQLLGNWCQHAFCSALAFLVIL